MIHGDSDKPDTETAALRLYLDESGDENPATPHSVLGGWVISRQAAERFEEEWDQMLTDHGIPFGLHMKEFGRPNGEYAGMSDCCRKELFIEACHLICKYRASMLTGSLSNTEYQTYIPPQARKAYSVYAMNFTLIVMANHKRAEFNNYADPIPIIMDSGNSKKGQVTRIHEFMQKRFQRLQYLHLGSLTFDDDRNWGMLQAADLIAWGTRRKISNVPFGNGFSPIGKLLSSDIDIPWKKAWLTQLGASLAEAIARGEGTEEPSDEELGIQPIQ